MSKQKPVAVLSEDGKWLTVVGPQFGVSHTFELVDRVPLGYSIWNIGENMADGYLPLCRLAAVQPFPGGRSIEVDTLKAIKCEGAQEILAAAGWGPETLDEMERAAILRTLQDTGDNKSEAARRLGITRATLHNKLRRYDME